MPVSPIRQNENDLEMLEWFLLVEQWNGFYWLNNLNVYKSNLSPLGRPKIGRYSLVKLFLESVSGTVKIWYLITGGR